MYICMYMNMYVCTYRYILYWTQMFQDAVLEMLQQGYAVGGQEKRILFAACAAGPGRQHRLALGCMVQALLCTYSAYK